MKIQKGTFKIFLFFFLKIQKKFPTVIWLDARCYIAPYIENTKQFFFDWQRN